MSRRSTIAVIAVTGTVAAVVLVAWRAADRAIESAAVDIGGAGGVAQAFLALRAQDLEAPSTLPAEPVTFEVAEGETVASVASRLASEGLIRDATAFRMLARAEGMDRGIQAGAHDLRADMDAETVLLALQVAAAPGVEVTIPEGRRVEEVAEILGAVGVADTGELAALARSASIARDPGLTPVADRPADAGLEGYLFPDTYVLDPEGGPEATLLRLVEVFAARYATAADAPAPSAAGLSAHEIVTVASIVEREAQLAAERPRIARVFLNRLEEPPYLLGADPTVQYALGLQNQPRTWWKRPLTLEDLDVPSPYNTYDVPGLPPGPIANPGLDALAAVMRPVDGAWQFFVANELLCDGSHVFATTMEEHEANVARYRTGTCLP